MVAYTTRRAFVRGLAGVAATTVVGTAAAGDREWTTVPTPTGNTLYDAAHTADGVHVVGAGGIVLRRESAGYEAVLRGGPGGNGRDLSGADATDDGAVLWFVGASGAVGAYDTGTGAVTDYSAPLGVTNNFTDVSVTGAAGQATVTVADDSGTLYTAPGEDWTETVPGSGAAINAVDHAAGTGFAVDADATVFRTADGGWERLGIRNADRDYYAVAADGSGAAVAGDAGTVATWDGTWHRENAGDAELRDVAVCACGCTFAAGGGGTVLHERGEAWRRESTGTGANLHAVLCCDGGRHVAVGASGTVIER